MDTAYALGVNKSLEEKHIVLFCFFSFLSFVFRAVFVNYGLAKSLRLLGFIFKPLMLKCSNIFLLLGGNFIVGFAKIANYRGPGTVYILKENTKLYAKALASVQQACSKLEPICTGISRLVRSFQVFRCTACGI